MLWTHSISNLESKISLRGPENGPGKLTVVPAGLAVAVALAVVVVEIAIGVGVGVLMEGEGNRQGRERERDCVWAGFWRVSDWFLTGFWLVSDPSHEAQLDLKSAEQKFLGVLVVVVVVVVHRVVAVAAGVVVVLGVVANLVMRVRIHAWTHSISNLGAK